ncbi:MAG: type I 3-dehydroquinate dehydratase, partial [Spirochaeta sp.]
MITVTLASGSYAEAVRHCDHPAEFANGVELRIDTWEAVDPVEVGHCLEQCRRRYTNVILTMRLQRDGGACTAGRRRRNRILLECVRKLPPDVYVDLEIEQLGSGEDDKLCTAIAEAGGRVIRSYHSFEPGVDMDALQQLGRVSGAELPKAAVMPESTGDLLQLLMFARSFRPGDQIVLGMGEWGMPSRMCPLVFGSRWTYAADSSGPAAPGQLTAAELAIRCRTHLHTPATKYFAIFGNPVMHSRSPEFHNQRFEEARYNAVYVPFPLSDADAGIRVIQQWPLVGVSVTIPHKHGVLLWENTDPEEAVQAVGAANTAVGGQFGIRLSNTDVEGFLYPLLERGFTLRSTRCLVIGAGGAARAVVYGLLLHGA